MLYLFQVILFGSLLLELWVHLELNLNVKEIHDYNGLWMQNNEGEMD